MQARRFGGFEQSIITDGTKVDGESNTGRKFAQLSNRQRRGRDLAVGVGQ
jgi:hypothetical protein